MRDKILFMLHGGEVSRFHTVNTIQRETVGHHSFGVATFCYIIAPESRRELFLAALFHDLAEQVVGDTPAPTKIALRVSERMGELEDEILRDAGFYVALNSDEQRILKIADCFHGMLFCIRDRSLGNRGVGVVYDRYTSYVTPRLETVKEKETAAAMLTLWKEACGGLL